MKLFWAIVVILMLLPLRTGVETSDDHASRSATALRDLLLRHEQCCGYLDKCENTTQCCEGYSCVTAHYCDRN
nr:conotoxin precursor I3 [Conus ebraeus]DAZ85838.1 TPA_inf: conotoxin precursor I3 [Conus ebraeus]DAZ85987.1 TPA_inf: conotoxin precursor I3 [Conus ebraeus]